MRKSVFIGVIGGSGLYRMDDMEILEEVRLTTPFGEPSDVYIIGRIGQTRVAFLPRHGRGHRLIPTEINFRANIFGFKILGVERLISVSAVGSMQETITPGMMVIPDQFVNMTRQRARTFFGDGLAAHVGMADPVCPVLSEVLLHAGRAVGAQTRAGGTYLCIEGPQFSTRAESRIFRSWGVDVIGMTNVPEILLAREAEICYATIAMATDYDCWHETEDDVRADTVVELLKKNIKVSQAIIREAVLNMPDDRPCRCGSALATAFITDPNRVPPETLRKLEPIVAKYFKREAKDER